MTREKAKSIIKVIKDPKKITGVDLHIAKVKGKEMIPRHTWYENTETGDVYSHIAGGIAWPGAGRAQQLSQGAPGFAVVVAVDKDADDGDPAIRTVAEVESADVYELVKECVKLRERWGYWERGGDVLGEWYGDYERFLTFTGEINDRLQERDGPENGFYMAVPADYEQANAFEIYLRRIQTCLVPDAEGRKGLILGSCNLLRNYLQNVPADASKRSADEYPAIAALGFVLHSLKTIRPWEHSIYDMSVVMGGHGIMEVAAAESDRELKRLADAEDEDLEDGPVGDMIPTVPGG